MTDSPKKPMVFACACGHVEIHAQGKPMTTMSCYCDDCQAGARYIESLPNAPRILDDQGGTDITLFRKDRVRYIKGRDLLRAHKNSEQTETNRQYATCCNTLMSVEFDGWQPWITLYAHTAKGEFPAREMRIFTKFSPASDEIPDDVPSHRTFPLWFPLKVFMTLAAMRLGL